jgi:hypothetical protein
MGARRRERRLGAEPLRRAPDPDAARRTAAAEALARWGQALAVPLLRWTAAADSDPDVARTALAGLRRIGSLATPAAREAIAALAEVAGDPARRADAIAALSHVTENAIPAVGECLSAGDPQVRRAVVEALGRLSHPTASAYVRSAPRRRRRHVRQAAVSVLAGHRTRGWRGRLRTWPDRPVPAGGAPRKALRRAGGDSTRPKAHRHDVSGRDAWHSTGRLAASLELVHERTGLFSTTAQRFVCGNGWRLVVERGFARS